MQFEVRVPDAQNPSRLRVVVVEARDWFSALRNALKEAGEDNPLRNVLCDLVSDGIYRVTETEGGRVFEIHEVADEEVDELDSLEFAPPEPVAPIRSLNHTLEPGATFETPDQTQDNLDAAQTMMDLPPLQLDDLESSAPAEPSPDTKKKKKRELASTMLMDFAAIIEAQGDEDDKGSKPIDATVEFRDFATKEELERQAPSVIVTEEAFTPVPKSRPSHRDMNATIREAKKPDPVPVAAAEPTPVPASAPGGDELSELTGASGQYKPGMTTEMLADVFMRAPDIADYGEDRTAAMNFVLDLALGDVKASGGGVLLTDLNSPDQDLWFEAASGPGSDVFRNFRIPLGQGIVGYYTQQGVNQVISDVQQEARFGEDMMRSAGVEIGPLLCAPMSYNDRVWGCVMLFNKPGSRPFTQGELSIITYLAYTTGEYLCNLNS